MSFDAMRQYEGHVKSFPSVSPSRERELSTIILGPLGIERDRAIWELVNGNMRRVLSLTKQYRDYQDYPDIVFDGNLGLVRAASDFDSSKGKFSTHATHRIKTAIREGIRTRMDSVCIPRTTIDVAMRIRKAISEHDKSDGVLAVELGVEVRDVVAARLAMLAMLDAVPMFDEDGEEMDVPDPRSLEMFDEMQKQDMLSLVNKAAMELGLTNDELVLVSEANLNWNDEARIAPVLAKKMGLTQQAVRYRRTKLVWEIRRKILTYVGGKEYLMMSAMGKLPANRWKDEKVSL